MTRMRSSPMGLEMYLPILLAFIMLPLLAQTAPLQDYTEITQYTEGCYYNYNHYNEGDRIMTNEPCLNCTCHNKMLMCYLRVCPFTKPIGHDCIVEKREDQCCPIITCPEVPVDVAHAEPESGTELSFPEKYGCSIDGKFYLEGAQVPSNPNKPCELCYCIRNRTSCLMQECTLHIDGCAPIYNRGSCCPVRYNCDHENDVLELEDLSTTTEVAVITTTRRPSTGFIITTTMTPAVTTDCLHNNEVYADGSRIAGETACENCYCMRGDIVCAVQECNMPLLKDSGKLCHPLPAAEGECCPSNYACEDDTKTTPIPDDTTLTYSSTLDEEDKNITVAPVKDLHSAIPEEDLQLQTHIDEEETPTKSPATEGATQENITKPAAIDNQDKQDAKPESTTRSVEQDEATTVPTSEVEVVETEEYLTTTSASSAKLPETSTEILSGAKNEDTTEATDKTETEYSTQETEAATKVPTSTDELTDKSTDTAGSGEELTAVTTHNIKDESTESVTNPSPADIGEEDEPADKTTKSAEENIPVAEHTTLIPNISEINEKFTTEHSVTSEEEHESVQSATIQTVQGEQAETTIPPTDDQQHEEQSTEGPLKLYTEDDISTKSPPREEESIDEKAEEQEAVGTEGNVDTTTGQPEKILPEQSQTEEKQQDDEKEEPATVEQISSDEKEDSTELADKKKPASSAEIEESEGDSKQPESTAEGSSTTTPPKIGDEDEESSTDNILTTPSYIDSERTSEPVTEDKPVSDEKQDITTDAPSQSEEQTTVLSANKKPIFDDDESGSGSGDYATEFAPETPSIIPTISPTTEAITSISKKPDEESATGIHILPVDDKPEEDNNVTELSEDSYESEEDTKLMDLTTARPSDSSGTTSADEALEKVPEEEKETITMTPSAEKVSEDKSEEAVISTTITPLEEKLTTEPIVEDKEKLFGEVEVSTVPSIYDDSSIKTDKIPEANEGSAEIENVTSQKPTEEEQSSTTGITLVEQSLIPVITDSPMVIMDDIFAFTTAKPTGQTYITTEPNIEPEQEQKLELTTTRQESSHEQAAPTTTKPIVEPSHDEVITDMQLPSSIPGEGDCLVQQKTYKNDTLVPTADECEVECKCVSSIVTCERVKCDVPENVEKCILDTASANKCCPTYICGNAALPSKGKETVEEDEAEEVQQHQTTEHPDDNESKITTKKPIYGTVSIPEIERPIAITQEPMSHIKEEEFELEQQTTKSPDVPPSEEKKDVLIADHSSTNEQEAQEIATEKLPAETPEKEPVPDHSVIQEQPENQPQEETTHANELEESSTVASVNIGNENQEEEIYTTTNAPTTPKPIEKGEHEDEKTEQETVTSVHIPLEEEPETQTGKTISDEITIEPHIDLAEESDEDKEDVQEPESHTIKPTLADELSTLAPSGDKFDAETTPSQEELEATTTSVESEDNSKDVSASTTTNAPTKDHTMEEAGITGTTALPTSDDFENAQYTTQQPSNEIKDNNIPSEVVDKELEITSTIASVTEEAGTESVPSEEDDKEPVKPSEQEIESSTVAFETNEATTAAEETSEHTISPTSYEEHETSSDESLDPSLSTEAPVTESFDLHHPDTQTSIDVGEDHTIATSSDAFGENNGEKETPTTSASVVNEDDSVHITALTSDSVDIATEKPNDIGANSDTSSLPSVYNTDGIMSTTASSNVQKEDENQLSEGEKPVEQQTQSSEETTENTSASVEKITESTEEDNITIPSIEQVKEDIGDSMAHTVAPSIEDEVITKSSDALQTQEDIDHSTVGPLTSDEYTTAAILAEKDEIPEKDAASSTIAPSVDIGISSTHVPAKQPSYDPLEETSGESVESEEEITTTPTHIGEFITQRVEDEEEQEASGEEDDKMESATDKPHTPTEIFVTTEQSEISNEDEISTDKAIQSGETIDQTTPKDASSITSTSSIEEVTEIQKEGLVTPVDEKELDVSTQQPQEDVSVSTQTPTLPDVDDKPGSENAVYVTKSPNATTQQYDNEDSTKAPVTSADDMETVAVEQDEKVTIHDSITEQPEQQQQDIDDDEKAATTQYPIASADIDSSTVPSSPEVESEEPTAFEITTARLPTYDISDTTTSHIPTEEFGENKEKDTEEDIEISTTEQIEQLDISTNIPVVSTDITTQKSPKETEEISEIMEVDTTTLKSPAIADEIHGLANTQEPISEIREDYTTQITTGIQYEVTTIGSNITEKPAADEIITAKLPEITDETTELSVSGDEFDNGESPDDSTKVSEVAESSTDKLPEQVTELIIKDEEDLAEVEEKVTELSTTGSDVQNEISDEMTTALPYESLDESPEYTTALPSKPITSEEAATELPAIPEISTVKAQEEDYQQRTTETYLEDEQTTRLPVDSQVEHATKLPTKDTESEEESHEKSTQLPLGGDIVPELPTQSQEQDAESHVVTDKTEDITKKPEDVEMSSANIPDHITELPTQSDKTEEEVHETTDNTELSPNKDIESEENLYDESTEKLSELPSKNTEAEASAEISTETPIVAHESATSGQGVKDTTDTYSNTTSTKEPEDISEVQLHSSTTLPPLFAHHTTLSPIDVRFDDTTAQSTPKKEETYTAPTTTTSSTSTAKPFTTAVPYYQPQPPMYGQPPQYGPTQYEDEYTDEDEAPVFGPGTCRYGGKLYVSAQQIPRDDPCDFCFCFRSDIICLQQSCPPPISGCHEEPISGFCCPRYECPVSMATTLNITTSTTTTSTTLPPHFLHHSYGNKAQRNGCFINGRSYRVGEKIESTSGPCINCTCGGDGKMKCDPQACVPEPTMQQVMAVVAAGRKR